MAGRQGGSGTGGSGGTGGGSTGMPAGTDTWDAQVYERFADERSRPFHDLLAQVGACTPAQVVDLGCGSGSGLLQMCRRWPDARLVGVDSSTDMLTASGALLGSNSQVSLVRAEAESWIPDDAVDVLVSNALLQWIPQHRALRSTMADWLAPGGWLATALRPILAVLDDEYAAQFSAEYAALLRATTLETTPVECSSRFAESSPSGAVR